MTTTLVHPPAEDLGRFVEGTLDAPGRDAIVAHIADCDECRTVVVDAAEFVEPVVVHSQRKWWMAAAAAIAMGLGGTIAWQALLKPLTPVIEASSSLHSRSVDGRLTGFTYVERHVPRGSESEAPEDNDELRLDGKIASVLQLRRSDPKTIHAKGVALLVMPKANAQDRDKAVALLQSAVTKDPNNVAFLSDLAVALVATADAAKLKLAVEVCDRALQINSRAPEVLFNRAKALELLGQDREAITAYDRFLAIDASSGWAKEVIQHRDMLKSSLPPS
jgi:hypothetical protein